MMHGRLGSRAPSICSWSSAAWCRSRSACWAPPRTGGGPALLAVVFASLYFPFIEYGALFLSEIHFIFWLALAFAGLFGGPSGPAARRRRSRSRRRRASRCRRRLVQVGRAARGVRVLRRRGRRAAAGAPRARTAPRAGSQRLAPWLLRGAVVAVAAAPAARRAGARLHARERGPLLRHGQQDRLRLPARPLRPHRRHRVAPRRGATVPIRQPRRRYLRHYERARDVPFAMTDNAANNAEAWRWIVGHPGEAIVLSLDHIYDTFFGAAMWPDVRPSARGRRAPVAVRVHRLPVRADAAGVRAVLRRGARAVLTSRTALVLAPVAALTITVAIATGEVRYRIPFDVFFIVHRLRLRVRRPPTRRRAPPSWRLAPAEQRAARSRS